MFRTFVLLAGVLASLWTLSSQAQEAVLGQLYDKGVHAYFSSDYAKAFQRLTAAIDAGSRDPRVFYFRGLAYLQLGRSPEAGMDFRKAADLESKDLNKYYNVGRSLERVQGSQRQLLESYRVEARLAAFEESERLRKARYETIKLEEARVLQQQAAEGAAEPAKESAETIPAPPAEATGAETAPETNVNPPDLSPEEKKSAQEKEAGADAATAAEPAAEDPFSKAAEKEKPAAEKKSTAEDALTPGPAAKTKEEKPAAESKPAAKKSIFGALGKSLTKAAAGGGDKAASPDVKPLPDSATEPAEKDKPADKPADNKAAEPADPFAN